MSEPFWIKISCKTESINALKKRRRKRIKEEKNKIFLKEKTIYIQDSSPNKGFQNFDIL